MRVKQKAGSLAHRTKSSQRSTAVRYGFFDAVQHIRQHVSHNHFRVFLQVHLGRIRTAQRVIATKRQRSVVLVASEAASKIVHTSCYGTMTSLLVPVEHVVALNSLPVTLPAAVVVNGSARGVRQSVEVASVVGRRGSLDLQRLDSQTSRAAIQQALDHGIETARRQKVVVVQTVVQPTSFQVRHGRVASADVQHEGMDTVGRCNIGNLVGIFNNSILHFKTTRRHTDWQGICVEAPPKDGTVSKLAYCFVHNALER